MPAQRLPNLAVLQQPRRRNDPDLTLAEPPCELAQRIELRRPKPGVVDRAVRVGPESRPDAPYREVLVDDRAPTGGGQLVEVCSGELRRQIIEHRCRSLETAVAVEPAH